MSAANTSEVSSIVFGGTTFDAVGSVSISAGRAPIEVTQLGSYNAHFLPGVLTSALALDIYYNSTNHIVFTDALIDATGPTAFTFTTASGNTITGSGYVTGVDIVASMGDIIRGSVSIQVTGTLTISANGAVQGGNET